MEKAFMKMMKATFDFATYKIILKPFKGFFLIDKILHK